MQEIVEFRRRMRDKFGLKMREEVHASPFINKPGNLVRIARNDRLAILRHFIDTISRLPDITITSVVVDKANKPAGYDAHEKAWQVLLQRFENTLSHRNFPGQAAQDDRGMIIVDGDQSGRLVSLVRRMRHFNYVPSSFGRPARNLPTRSVIEDPVFRDSRHSLLIQAADVAAYFLYQQESPNAYMRKSGGKAYFNRLDPVLNKLAARGDRQGMVRIRTKKGRHNGRPGGVLPARLADFQTQSHACSCSDFCQEKHIITVGICAKVSVAPEALLSACGHKRRRHATRPILPLCADATPPLDPSP